MKMTKILLPLAVVATTMSAYGRDRIPTGSGGFYGDGLGYRRPSPTPIVITEPGFNMSVRHVVKKLEDAADDIKKRILKDVDVYSEYLQDLASDATFEGDYCTSRWSLPTDSGLLDLSTKVEGLKNSYKRSAEKIRAEARDLADKVDDLKNLRNAKKNLAKDLEDLYDLLDKEETSIPLQSRTIAAIGALEFLVDELPNDLD